MVGFDLDNSFISMRLVKSTLRSVPGVRSIKRRFFSDDRVTFVYNGVRCTVNEAWGDNPVYWVSPENAIENPIDMSLVHAAFAARSSFSVAIECLAWMGGGVAAFFLFAARF